MSIVNGSNQATRQPSKYGFRTGSGFYSIESWRGPKAAVASKASEYVNVGWDYEVTEETGPFATITATVPNSGGSSGGTEVPQIKWQLEPNTAEKDLLDWDNDAINAISAKNKDIIRNKLANPPGEGEAAVTAAAFDVGGNPNLAFDLYKLMAQGVKSGIVFAPVLQRNTIVSNAYETAASTANAGKVLSSARVMQETDFPAVLQIAINQAPFTTPPKDAVRFYTGWLKEYPTMETLAYGKVQITQRWRFGIWARLIWDVVT